MGITCGLHSASEAAYTALASTHVHVLQISDLPSREVVPGDMLEMHVGDRVPADTRIITLKTATLRAEQASLTGESVAVLKSVEAVQEEGCELQAKVGMIVTLCTLRFLCHPLGRLTALLHP